MQTSKSRQPGFRISPKTLYSIYMAFGICEFICSVTHTKMLLIAKIYKAVITTPTVRMYNRIKRDFSLYDLLQRSFAAIWYYFRKFFPNLKMVGFDFISISSFSSREQGRVAHRKVLEDDKPILPIEDMKLQHVHSKHSLIKVVVAHLLIEGADGSPCTVICELN